MKYLLDTNACIFLMKGHPAVVAAYRTHKESGVCMSAITAAELHYGVYNSTHIVQNTQSLANFLIGVEVLPFGDAAAMEYGRLRAVLRKNGTPIGSLDMLIAAHAKAACLTLVTNNTREFLRVDGLLLTDWML